MKIQINQVENGIILQYKDFGNDDVERLFTVVFEEPEEPFGHAVHNKKKQLSKTLNTLLDILGYYDYYVDVRHTKDENEE